MHFASSLLHLWLEQGFKSSVGASPGISVGSGQTLIMATGTGPKGEAELSRELQEKGWYNIKTLVGAHKGLNCNLGTCGQKTCIICMGIDAYKKYWEPVVQSIGTMVPQIAGSYKDPIYTLVKYDGTNIVTFINKWCEMLWTRADFRKQLSHAGFIYLEPETIIRDLLGSNAGNALELMEAKAMEGKIRFARAHYDMGNAFYGKWLQEQGLRQSMGEVKAGDMVEALLSFNWWQERAGQRLDMMGNKALFRQELQNMLLEANLRYQGEEPEMDRMGCIWNPDKDDQGAGTPGGSPAASAEEQKEGRTMLLGGGRLAAHVEKEQETTGTGIAGSTISGFQGEKATEMERVLKTVLETMAKKEGKQILQQPARSRST